MNEQTKICGVNVSLWTLLTLIVTAYLVYGSILNHSFVDYDDYRIIVDRAESYDGISLKTLKKIFIEEFPREEPLLTRDFSYLINAEIFGPLNPSGYLLGNLLLHIAVSYTVFVLALLLFPKNYGVAALSAFIFVLHPIHVESVAWISSRKDSLYALFYLLAFIQYLNYVRNEKKGNLVFSFLFFVLALFSKSAAISYLPLVICYRCIVDRQKKVTRPELIFFVSIFITTMLFVHWYTGILREYGVLDESKGFFNRDWFAWLLSICEYFTFYLEKLFFPFQSAIFYEFPASVIVYANKTYLVMSLSIVAGVGALFYTWRKNQDYARLFLLSFFVCGLLPYLELAQVRIYVAERYLYVSSIPFCIMIALYSSEFYLKFSGNKKLQILMVSLLCCILFFWGYRTIQACTIWENTKSFWEDNLSVSPERTEPHTGIMRYYQKLAIYTEDEVTQKEYLMKAKTIGEKALDRFCPTRKNCTITVYQITATMAEIEWNLHNYEKTDMFFTATFHLVPAFIESRFMYASFLLERKRYKEALEQIQYLEKNLHPFENKQIADELRDRIRPAVEQGILHLKE
jgi:protein O-mannosyl-transferase